MSYSKPNRPLDFCYEYSSQPTKRLQLGPEFPDASLSGSYVYPLASSMVPSSCHTIEELRVLDPGYRSDFGGHEHTWDTHSDSIWDHAAIDTTIQGRASAEAFEPAFRLDEEVCFGLVRG
jgi:hypothetical protein